MAKRQPPKRLFKAQDRVSSYLHDRSPIKRMNQTARDHEDVLQNIESVLVIRHREDPSVDDRVVDEALGASLHDVEPTDARALDVFDGLKAIRRFREDIDDGVWRDALRVVQDSVRRHSQRRPGETSYLAFAGRFIV